MTAEPAAPRITLRQLPLAARLVLSVFLIAVGLGYFSAMIQLHMKHSKKDGEPLPTPADVVEVFSGLKKFDPNEPTPCGRIDALLSGDPLAPDVSKDNMAPAFLAKSKGWTALQNARRGDFGTVKAEREGERQAFLAWVRSDAATKKLAYQNDSFTLPVDKKGQPITAEFLHANGDVKVKSLVDARCQNCHGAGQEPSLGKYADLESLITPPSQEIIDGKWVRSSRQTTVEHLTQSTHAHLLTFAVLFCMTGLTFAFTTYWGVVRGVVAPVVLLAQVADISCWWLARVPTYGIYFAYAILGTGTIVGMGLIMQIVLSLLNMYGIKGKAVVLLILFGGIAGVAYLGAKVIQPALDAEREETQKAKTIAAKPEEPKKPVEVVQVPKAEVSHLEKLIMGPAETDKDHGFNGKGTMAPAFFEKDGSGYKKQIKDNPALKAEREGERLALQAWLNSPPADREKAFAADSFPRLQALADKPITPDYLTDAKAVKVKSIITDRCARCHCAGGDQEDYPLETYEHLKKYLAPATEKPNPKAKD